MLNRLLVLLFLVTSLLIVEVRFVEAKENQLSQRVDKNWAQSSYWQEDGAEVSLYQSREMVDRRPRQSQATFIFERNFLGDAKNKNMYFEFQQIGHFDVGVFPRSQIYSSTLSVPDLRVLSVNVTRQEWGRQFLKQLQFASTSKRDPYGSFQFFERGNPVPTAVTFSVDNLSGSVPYEVLPLLIRAINLNAGSFSFLLVEPIYGDSTQKPRSGSADVVIQPEKEITLGPNKYNVRPVVITHFLGEDTFWLESKGAKRLVRWLRFNGSEYELIKTERLDYWNKTSPRDVGLMY